MEDMTESETTIAWLWIVEAMASFKEVSLSLIRDLLKEAPELPCGLAKNAKERIALRCLEDLCARQSRRASDNPSSQGSKVEFLLSESCENVLQRIVQETPESDLKAGGPELAKYDILSFVRHKEAHLPKLALEKLRDSILDGTHPYADFLREKSGLGSTSRENGVCKDDKNQNSVTSRPNLIPSDVESERVPPIIENKGKESERSQQNGDVLPSKRVRSDSNGEDRAVELENRDGIDKPDIQNVNRKKAKLCAFSDDQSFEQFPLCEKKSEEGLSERNVSVTTSGHDLAGSDTATAEQGRVLEGDSNDCTVSKQSRDSDKSEFHEDGPERESRVLEGGSNLCTVSKRSSDSDKNEFHEDGPEREGRVLEGVSNYYKVSKRSSDSDENELHKDGLEREGMVLEDGSNDCTVSKRSHDSDNNVYHENGPQSPCNVNVMPRETTTSEPHVCLSPDESIGVNENRAEASDIPSTETVHKKSSTEEPKSSNEHDLQFPEPNSAADGEPQKKTIASEENKNAECREAEISSASDGYCDERTDVAKKKHEFLSSQIMDSHESLVADSSEQNLCMKCNEAGQALVCNSNDCQVVVHEKCLGSSVTFGDKGNFYCPFCAYSLAISEYLEAKKRSSLSRKELSAFIRRGSVKNQPIKSTRRLNKKKKHRSGLREDENFLGKNLKDVQLEERAEDEENQVANDVNEENDCEHRNVTIDNHRTEFTAVCNNIADLKREKGEKVVEDCPSAGESEGPQNEVPPKSDNLASTGDKDHVNKTEEDVDTPIQLAQEFSLDSSEADGDDLESNYCISIRERETRHKTYPVIPQPKRKCLPWTAEEKQKIKEGVQKFSDHKKIPWKKILESGATVFLDCRTSRDLKNKWRNMCGYRKRK